ncbi:consortin-like isoform X2 [Ruditapes philippinarum]|uniref:consortin-like isoform X2 n=1 Tax=Ruditapes philippinarum TaxID=129788 RepID=UPI00295AF92B|nr:consortin-like isoform X2 [Ruditapes philippinarum]
MEKSEDMLKKEETDSTSASKETGVEGVSDMKAETTTGHDVVRKEAENLDDKMVEKETLGDEVKTSDVIDKESQDSSGVEDVELTKKSEDPDIQAESVENEKADLSKEPALDDAGRNQMFEEGLKLDKEGKKVEALKRYLKCLVGLKENSRFALLPQCLRNIGDIYYGRDEFDKAISFIQAEKLYYESVLIDDTELQKHIDEVTKQGAGDTADTNIDALRASEYEQLAKLCLDEKQPQLALEYAGKCTKLRQKVYGDNHPLVQQSLDFFATVYAEVGKVQYTESMSKYAKSGEPDITSPTVSWETTPADTPEPTSILRKRKNTEGDREKKVRFDESQVPSDAELDREEKCARFVLLCFFFILLFVLFLLGIYLFCRLQSPSTCTNVGYFFSDTVMQIKFWYYKFFSSANSKYT